MNNHKLYGPNIATWGLLNDHQLSITCPSDIETILSSSKLIHKKSHDYQFLHDWLGRGLLTSSGPKWQQRRKTITPAFHFTILEQFIGVFNQQSSVLVDKVNEFAGTNQEVNVYNFITLCALDIICETAMGVTINAQDQPDTAYVQAVKEMSGIIFKRAYSVLSQFKWTFPFTQLYRRQRKVLQVLHGFSDQTIKLRRAQLMDQVEEDGKEKKKCFLDLLLLNEGLGLSSADVREEVDTFMFGGHDTITSGIAFTLYHLSRQPEIQERVYQEIMDIEVSSTGHFDYSNLQSLKYLEMVIKESMRITPPVPMLGRELTEDTVIGGVRIATGTTINIPIYALHHSEDVFPDPGTFNPERFSAENAKKRHSYAYIPFSAGQRNCMGQKFAMWEMKTLIAKFVREFKLFGDSEVMLQADLVLRSANGVNVRVEKR